MNWLFAEQLKKDKELLNNNENISLCAILFNYN